LDNITQQHCSVLRQQLIISAHVELFIKNVVVKGIKSLEVLVDFISFPSVSFVEGDFFAVVDYPGMGTTEYTLKFLILNR